MTEPARISDARHQVRAAVAQITDAIEARDVDGVTKAISCLVMVAYDIGLQEGFRIAEENADASCATIDFSAARAVLEKELRA